MSGFLARLAQEPPPGLRIRSRVSREVRARASASQVWPAARVSHLAVKPENGVYPVPYEGMRPTAEPGGAALHTEAQAEVRSWPDLAKPAPAREDARSGRRFLPKLAPGALRSPLVMKMPFESAPPGLLVLCSAYLLVANIT